MGFQRTDVALMSTKLSTAKQGCDFLSDCSLVALRHLGIFHKFPIKHGGFSIRSGDLVGETR
jgi:hypothetical protein